LLSDALSARFGIESLRYAFLAASFVNLWAAVHYFVAGRRLKGDLALARISH
jgi:hypothetical protein